MEIVPSNSENNDDQPLVKCKRKRTTVYKNKSSSSCSNNRAISMRNSKSSSTKSASGSGHSETPPRAIGLDGHFYECVKCNEVGSLICCDTCACTYHYVCLDPPLECIPEGDWYCLNCSEEGGNLSDSTVNLNSAGSSSSKRQRRSLQRACKVKVSSGCCLCSNIKKKLIPDENNFFSFRTRSTAQSKRLSDRRQPSALNADGVGSAIIPHNTNNADKRLVLRPRKRAEEKQIETRKSGRKRASSSSSAQAAEKDQNVNLPPRRRGRPPKKRTTDNEPSTVMAPQQNEQQAENQKSPDLGMVLYGANLPQEYLAAIKAAHEAVQRSAGIKEIPWSSVELDALWVGVRRHGPDNWDTILEDPNLNILVLCMKTSPVLSYRWQMELQKMYSIVKSSSAFVLPSPPSPTHHHQPLDHNHQTPEPPNGEATTAQQLLPPPPQIPVTTSTESGPLLASNHHRGSSSSSASIPPAAAQPVVAVGGDQPVDHQTPEPAAISDGELATAQQTPPVTSTESGSLLIANHQGSSSSSLVPDATVSKREDGGGDQPVVEAAAAIISEGEKLATAQPLPVTSTESGPLLVPNHQGSSSSSSILPQPAVTVSDGEACEKPIEEANTYQELVPPEIPVASPESGPNNYHKGTSCFSSLKASPSSVARACDDDIAPLIPVAAAVSNGEAAGREGIEANTDQQHLAVTSSSINPRACATGGSFAPPRWRPNLNLHPMANHILFEAFRQRTSPETDQMTNHNIMGVEAAPPIRVAMAAQSPPVNSTVRPTNLFLGGCFPVRNRN